MSALDELTGLLVPFVLPMERPECTCPRNTTCTADCWFSKTDAQHAELRLRAALEHAVSLEVLLAAVVERRGPADAYRAMRKLLAEDLCPNCGCPVGGNETHAPANLGMCYIGYVASAGGTSEPEQAVP